MYSKRSRYFSSEQQKVVEVQRVVFAKLPGVFREGLPHLARRARLREICGRVLRMVLGLRHPRGEGAWREDLVVQLSVFDDALPEALLVLVVVDHEGPVEAQPVDVHAEDPRAHRVERHDPHPGRGGARQLFDAVGHLPGRRVGECQREDPGRVDVLFTGTRSRQHEKRPFGRFHREALRVVESGKIHGVPPPEAFRSSISYGRAVRAAPDSAGAMRTIFPEWVAGKRRERL